MSLDGNYIKCNYKTAIIGVEIGVANERADVSYASLKRLQLYRVVLYGGSIPVMTGYEA